MQPQTLFAQAVNPVGVQYDAHVQNIGWQDPVSSDGQVAGTVGEALSIEALKVNLVNAPAGASIKYDAHVRNIGWQDPVIDGVVAGTVGKALSVEALKITLENMPGYSIQYQAHVKNIGWQDWVSDGQVAGTVGKALNVEAIRIRIVKISDNSTISVKYQGHVQEIGWQAWVSNGQVAGTEGQRLSVEALKISLVNAPAGASIKYDAHVRNVGWQDPVNDGQLAGTVGKALSVEALKITLENMPGYSIQYQAHVKNIGWQDWVSDGQLAGTVGKALSIEAIRIRIVPIAVTSVSAINCGANDQLTVTFNKNVDQMTSGQLEDLYTSLRAQSTVMRTVNGTLDTTTLVPDKTSITLSGSTVSFNVSPTVKPGLVPETVIYGVTMGTQTAVKDATGFVVAADDQLSVSSLSAINSGANDKLTVTFNKNVDQMTSGQLQDLYTSLRAQSTLTRTVNGASDTTALVPDKMSITLSGNTVSFNVSPTVKPGLASQTVIYAVTMGTQTAVKDATGFVVAVAQ